MELSSLKISFKKADSFSMKTGVNEITLENVDDGCIELKFEKGQIILKENITPEKENLIISDSSLLQISEESDLYSEINTISKEKVSDLYNEVKNITNEKTIEDKEKFLTEISIDKNLIFTTIMFIGIDNNCSMKCFNSLKKIVKEVCEKKSGELFEIESEKIIGIAFGNKTFVYDHSIKAILCAVEIKSKISHDETLPISIKEHLKPDSLKIGIDSGKIKAFEDKPCMSMGSHGKVAYEIMKGSKSGSIFISRKTFINSRGIFKYKKSNKISLEGKKHELQLYKIENIKKHPYLIEPITIGNIEIPYIGNEKELSLLKQIWEKTFKSKQTQLVTISGIANSGKTSIKNEFLKYIVSKNIEVNIYSNNSSYKDNNLIPMYPFKQIFLHKILKMNSEETVSNTDNGLFNEVNKAQIHTIREYLKSLLEGKLQNVEEAIDLTFNLIGIGIKNTEHIEKVKSQTENMEIRAFFIFKTILEYITKKPSSDLINNLTRYSKPETKFEPILLIIDDLQWIDEQSLRFIEYLSTSVKKRSLFILCLTRPIYFNTHKDWGKFRDNYINIKLNYLTNSQSLDLIQKILYKIDDLPADLVHNIAKISNGNPAHIIELINFLIDQKLILVNENEDIWYLDVKGIKNHSLPTSLDYTVLVRFDMLEDRVKHVLSLAAVIGHQITIPFLEKVFTFKIDSIITLLQKRHFIFHNFKLNQQTNEFHFTFHYVKNSIYRAIKKSRKLNLHKMVYNELAEKINNTSNPELELIINSAIHLLNLEEGEKASLLLMKAAGTLLEVGSKFSALEIYNKIVSSVNLYKLPNIAMELYLNRGSIYLEQEDYPNAAKDFDALISISERSKNLAVGCRAMNLLSITFEKMNDLDRAYEFARSSLSLAERIGSIEQKAMANICLGNIFEKRGQLNQAEEYFNRTEVLMTTIDDKKGLSELLLSLGRINYKKKEYDKAIDLYMKAININKEQGNNLIVCTILIYCAETYEAKKLHDEALKLYKEALKLSESTGDIINNVLSFEKCASLLLKMGQIDEALTYYLEAIEIRKELNDKKSMAKIYFEMGNIYREKEKLRKATEYFDKAIDIYNELNDKLGMAKSLKNIADIYKKKDNIRSALRCYKKSIEIMEQMQYNEGLLSAYKEIGDIYRKIGDNVKAIDYRAKISLISKNINIKEKR